MQILHAYKVKGLLNVVCHIYLPMELGESICSSVTSLQKKKEKKKLKILHQDKGNNYLNGIRASLHSYSTREPDLDEKTCN